MAVEAMTPIWTAARTAAAGPQSQIGVFRGAGPTTVESAFFRAATRSGFTFPRLPKALRFNEWAGRPTTQLARRASSAASPFCGIEGRD
eukprot:6231755-Alexandrium_andersonii.AAC.1